MPQPLVLLPGLLNTRRLYERQIADLGSEIEAIVPELWHHDTIAAMAESVLKVAPERFALGGFSMGGYVAFEILRQAPHRVTRLALMDTQATPDTSEATTRRKGFIEQTKLGRFHGVQPSLLPQIVHRDHLNDQSIVQPILEMAAEVGADGFCRSQTAMIARADSRPLLIEIKQPTLVLVGREDLATPLARAEEMAADISHSQLVVLDRCGHMAPLEKPAEVTAALRRWLAQ